MSSEKIGAGCFSDWCKHRMQIVILTIIDQMKVTWANVDQMNTFLKTLEKIIDY